MFTEHLLYDKYHAEPWDYNGEKQALVLVTQDGELNGGRGRQITQAVINYNSSNGLWSHPEAEWKL